MIIITGPTSFIGRKVISLLLKHFNKSEILCLCWNKDVEANIANRKIIDRLKLPVRYIDLVTKKGLNNIPKSPDIVVHMAANTDTSSKNHKVNDIGTRNLIKALGKLGQKTHIIYTSTTTFLGGRKNCLRPLNEESPSYPTNEYGRSKLRAEKYLIKECKKQKFRLTIFRLNTVYGPDSRPKSMFKLLPEQIRKRSLFVRVNWLGLTSIVHVDDVAKAIIYFTKNKLPKPGVPQIFILSGESLTVADICKIFYKEMKIKYNPIIIPDIFWGILKLIRPYICYMEYILPESLYNPFWRASLIIDNAVWCETNKVHNIYPGWKPLKIKRAIKSILS